MKMTVEVPDYVGEIYSREAEARQLTCAVMVAKTLTDIAHSHLLLLRDVCISRTCSACGNTTDIFPIGHGTPARTCEACGRRLSKDRDRIDVAHHGVALKGAEKAEWFREAESFLRRVNRKREALYGPSLRLDFRTGGAVSDKRTAAPGTSTR